MTDLITTQDTHLISGNSVCIFKGPMCDIQPHRLQNRRCSCSVLQHRRLLFKFHLCHVSETSPPSSSSCANDSGFFCDRPVSETLAARSAALLRRQERDSGGAARFDLYLRRLPQKPALNCTRRGTVGCRRSARPCCCQLASGLEAGRRRQEESPSEAGCGRRL